MTGEGLWKRYDVGRIPNHAGVRDVGTFRRIFANAKAGNWGKVSGSKGNNINIAQITTSSSLNKLRGCHIGPQQDIFVGSPLGNNDRFIFSPGLNQFWVTYDSSRRNVMAWVATGATADSNAKIFYIGCGENNQFEATISVSFTSYSASTNPIQYKMRIYGYRDETFPYLYVDVNHDHSGGGHYVQTQWFCDHASSSLIDTWDVDDNVIERVGSWFFNSVVSLFTKEDKMTLQLKYYSLFAVKAVQIYDLCHCYNTRQDRIIPCVGVNDAPDFVHVLGRVIRDGLSWLNIDVASWNTIPQVLIRGHWRQCVRDWRYISHSSNHLMQENATSEANDMMDSDLASEDQQDDDAEQE